MASPDSHGKMYVGLMSGTSMDGIDAAIFSFDDNSCAVVGTLQCPYPEELRAQLLVASRQPANCTVDDIGRLDQWVGECFRDATNELIAQESINRSDITAIGSHGQTLRHQPDLDRPFTLQIGDPNIIAAGTGIRTVADFRRRDIAEGGQGAPLAPVFHHWLFTDEQSHRVVLNIGGVANVTCLPTDGSLLGFDTGPGNTLLDAWHQKHHATAYDKDGAWSASGTVNAELLNLLLGDPYFRAQPPKSTGFEYFNLEWLSKSLDTQQVPNAADVQATLRDLTACTIGAAITRHAPETDTILVCGGGIHNTDLIFRLEQLVEPATLISTADFGLDPDWVEAAAFAWLAMRTIRGEPGNRPSVTGASREAVLGGIYG
jgi:anhydro-N-acetylmuramic acid kinase